MSENPRKSFERKILRPSLSINSGVYAAVSPDIAMRLNTRGEYEYFGTSDLWYADHAESLLAVSAFGGVGPAEPEIAESLFPASGGARSHPIIGNYQGLYAGFATEGRFRENGSSGGITSWLLAELLQTGHIDAVIHMVPTPDDATLFDYRISNRVAEVANGSKSRYYPGQLAAVLTEISSTNRRYALTAIPSFAYEVRLLQEIRPEFLERIPFIIGLVCGHQKSATYATQLGWRAGFSPGQVRSIDFRKKDMNAPANRYVAEIIGLQNGKETVRRIRQGSTYETDWGLGLFKSNFSDFTEDVFNETADVVLGDAWLPRYVQDSHGTNIVIARSPEIQDLLLSARSSGRLYLEDLNESDVLESQSALVRHSVVEVHERFEILSGRGEYTPEPRRPAGVRRVGPLRRRIQDSRLDLARRSHDAWLSALAAKDISVFDSEMAHQLQRYRRLQTLIRLRLVPRRVVSRLRRVFFGFKR